MRRIKSVDKHDRGAADSTGLRVRRRELILGQMLNLMIPSAKMFSPNRNRLLLWDVQPAMGAAHHSRVSCDFLSSLIVATLH